MFDTRILNARIVFENGVQTGNIYIRDGKFAAFSEDVLEATDTYDADGNLVFPGAVDPHVHLNDPGMTESEDYHTGTQACAAGGITTVFDMPLTDPVTDDEPSFLLKKSEAEKKSIVDYGLYMALTPDNYRHLADFEHLRPIGYKAFMAYSAEIKMVNDGELYAGMEQIAKLGHILAVHCENNDIINFTTTRLKEQGRTDPLAYAESRPPEGEWESIQRAVTFAKLTGARLHVVHSSTPEGIDIVNEAQAQGHSISVETAQHYLLLSTDDLVRQGPYAQCNPPLRPLENQELLWERIENGGIDVLGSDHAPYTFAEKDQGLLNIWESPGGFSSIQTVIPMFISRAIERGVPLERVAELISGFGARRYGIYPQKGAIRLGADADFFVLRPESWRVDTEDLFYKQRWTPYEGMEASHAVADTWLRGHHIYTRSTSKGEILVAPGFGAFIPGQNRQDSGVSPE